MTSVILSLVIAAIGVAVGFVVASRKSQKTPFSSTPSTSSATPTSSAPPKSAVNFDTVLGWGGKLVSGALKLMGAVIAFVILWMILKGVWFLNTWRGPTQTFSTPVVESPVESTTPSRGYDALLEPEMVRSMPAASKPVDVKERLWQYTEALRRELETSLQKTPGLEYVFYEPQAEVTYNPAVEGAVKNVPVCCLLKETEVVEKCKSGSHLLCRCSPDPPEGMVISMSRNPSGAVEEYELNDNWAYMVLEVHDIVQVKWVGNSPPNQTFRIRVLHQTLRDLRGWIKPEVDGGVPCLQVGIKLPPARNRTTPAIQMDIPLSVGEFPVEVEAAGLLLSGADSQTGRVLAFWMRPEDSQPTQVRMEEFLRFRTTLTGTSTLAFSVIVRECEAGGILLLSFRPSLDYSLQF